MDTCNTSSCLIYFVCYVGKEPSASFPHWWAQRKNEKTTFWNNYTTLNIQKKVLWIWVCNPTGAYPGPSPRKLRALYDAMCLQQPVNILQTIWFLQRKNLLRHLTSKRLDQSTRDFAGRFSSRTSTRSQIFAAIRHLERLVNRIAVFRAFSRIKSKPEQLELRGFDHRIQHAEFYQQLFFRENWPPNSSSIADRAYDLSTGHISWTV